MLDGAGMIFVNNSSGQTILTGAEWPSLTGQSLPQSLNRNWLERVHPADRNLVEDVHNRGIELQSEYSMRYRLLRPDGGFRWVSVGAQPSFGPPNYTYLGCIGSMVVLTETSTASAEAYGNIRRYVPPPLINPPSGDEHLEQIADHMLLATALLEANDVSEPLESIRHALFELGRIIARRGRQLQTRN